MGPRGGLDLPFGSLWDPCGPTVPPGSTFRGFWSSFGGSFGAQNLSKLVFILDVVLGCVFDGFGSGFGDVLGDIFVPKGGSKGKGWIFVNPPFTYVILTFSRVVASIWGTRKREGRSAKRSRSPHRCCDDVGTILGGILQAKIVQRAMWNFIFLRAGLETLSRRSGGEFGGGSLATGWDGAGLGVVCFENNRC